MQCTIGGGGIWTLAERILLLGLYKRRNGKEMKDVL